MGHGRRSQPNNLHVPIRLNKLIECHSHRRRSGGLEPVPTAKVSELNSGWTAPLVALLFNTDTNVIFDECGQLQGETQSCVLVAFHAPWEKVLVFLSSCFLALLGDDCPSADGHPPIRPKVILDRV